MNTATIISEKECRVDLSSEHHTVVHGETIWKTYRMPFEGQAEIGQKVKGTVQSTFKDGAEQTYFKIDA